MGTAIEASELVARIREEVQIFGIGAIVNGFPSDPPARPETTRILPALNTAYKQMRRWWPVQCYLSIALVSGQDSYTFAETDYSEDGTDYTGTPFNFIEEAFLVSPDGDKIYPLEQTTNTQQNNLSPYRKNNRTRRPFELWVEGDRFGFDATPDAAYTLRLLVDTIPDDLVNSYDKPKRLPYTLHEGLIYGGAVEIARKALASPEAQSFPAGRFRRYDELKYIWNSPANPDSWMNLAKRLANSRFAHSSKSPVSVGINDLTGVGGWGRW